MSSLPPTSRRLADGIRGHWGIENRLHRVKDVIYEEDFSPQKSGLAPINLSLIKTWVLTLLKVQGFNSITEAISEISHDLSYMLTICF
jgi:predicted transposase YbfD/YdcC